MHASEQSHIHEPSITCMNERSCKTGNMTEADGKCWLYFKLLIQYFYNTYDLYITMWIYTYVGIYLSSGVPDVFVSNIIKELEQIQKKNVSK